MSSVEDDLNKVFAELDTTDLECFIDRRKGQWTISMSKPGVGGSRQVVSVFGEGTSLRLALSDAFARMMQLLDVLEWKPWPAPDYRRPPLAEVAEPDHEPHSPIARPFNPDDDIPF